MNEVILTGRLTREPDVRYTQSSQPTCVARFTLAVDRKYKKEGEQSADFPACIAFGKRGEFVEKYAHQGMKFNIVGHLQTGSYVNRDGNKVYTTDVVVDEIEFGESKREQSSNGEVEIEDLNAFAQSYGNDFVDVPDGVDDDGLPFN